MIKCNSQTTDEDFLLDLRDLAIQHKVHPSIIHKIDDLLIPEEWEELTILEQDNDRLNSENETLSEENRNLKDELEQLRAKAARAAAIFQAF